MASAGQLAAFEFLLRGLLGNKGVQTSLSYDPETDMPEVGPSGAYKVYAKPVSGWANALSGGQQQELADRFNVQQADLENQFVRSKALEGVKLSNAVEEARQQNIAQILARNNIEPTPENIKAFDLKTSGSALEAARTGMEATRAENLGREATAGPKAKADVAESGAREVQAKLNKDVIASTSGDTLAQAIAHAITGTKLIPLQSQIATKTAEETLKDVGKPQLVPITAGTELNAVDYTGNNKFDVKPLASNLNTLYGPVQTATAEKLALGNAQQSWMNNNLFGQQGPVQVKPPGNGNIIPQPGRLVYTHPDGSQYVQQGDQLIRIK